LYGDGNCGAGSLTSNSPTCFDSTAPPGKRIDPRPGSCANSRFIPVGGHSSYYAVSRSFSSGGAMTARRSAGWLPGCKTDPLFLPGNRSVAARQSSAGLDQWLESTDDFAPGASGREPDEPPASGGGTDRLSHLPFNLSPDCGAGLEYTGTFSGYRCPGQDTLSIRCPKMAVLARLVQCPDLRLGPCVALSRSLSVLHSTPASSAPASSVVVAENSTPKTTRAQG
jgi:hypothetical protein